jgi:putative ABC transport system ATP-binding protein
MALVELTGVSKTYDGGSTPVQALTDVTLTLDEQAFVALMGRSGSGKSTLLSVLGAMNPPTAGRAVVDGIDVYALGVERRADFRREYLGFVFQQLHLMPFLTAAENVMLPLAAARVPNRVQRDLAGDALERVGLADKTTRLPRDLSGGEQQRVAIARALVNKPALVLADEPTGCLDSQTGREIMELLLALRSEGLTVFVVTHDAAVAACADSVITLEDGRIVPPIRSAPAGSVDRIEHKECVPCTSGSEQG